MEIPLEKLVRILLSLAAGGTAIIFDQPFASVLTALLVLMLMDMVTALIANGKRRTIDPNTGWMGWRKKAGTIILLLAIKVLEALSTGAYPTTIEVPAAAFIGAGFCMMELLSIVRNAILCGVIIPEPIRKLFRDQLGQG